MKKNMVMGILMVVFLLLVGCGKNEGKNESFENIDDKNEPKYTSKYFSSTALVEMVSQIGYLEEPLNKFKEIYEKINGRVLDTFFYNDCIYFLTSDGIYCVQRILAYVDELDIDVKNNTEIAMITEEYVVLKNDAGELTVYFARYGRGKYASYNIPEFYMSDGDMLSGYSDIISWDYLYILTNIDKSGISAKTFSMGKAFNTEYNKFIMQNETVHPFSMELSSNIKEYVRSKYNYSLRGMLLLENNNAYFVDGKFGDLYSDETIKVRTEVVENVDRIFNSAYHDRYFVIKNNDENTIYKYEILETTLRENKIALSNGIKTSDILNVSVFNRYGLFVIHSNGDIYRLVRNELVKNDTITNLFSGKDNIEFYMLDGWIFFVMDDGYIYTLLDDNMINAYNLN